MAKRKKQWIYSPRKAKLPKPSVPQELKAEIEAQAQRLLEELRPNLIKPPSESLSFNYLTELWTKWYRHYFYFGGTYACPGPNAISPTFEARFARMEYVGEGRWNLAYMRHTGRWWEVLTALPTAAAFEALRREAYFFPG